MKTYKIAAIPGDGIGTEVIAAGIEVLELLARQDGGFRLSFEHFDWGSAYYLRHGEMMPADGLARLRNFDAIYFGAVGSRKVPDHITLWGRRLNICQGFAFVLARNRPKRHLTLITKSNAQRHGMVMWDEIFASVAKDYPEVETDKMLVDAATMRMVLRPASLDVMVATNLHADILSDLAAALSGSLGIAPTANLDPERRFPSMFEPIHGSALDIAGKGIANPIGTFWTAVMMLEHLGESGAAARLMDAIESVTQARIYTPDLGGKATTAQVTQALCKAIETLPIHA